MKQIVTAVDLSDLAMVAIDKSAEMAIAFGAKVHLLHVEAPPPAFIGNEVVPTVVPGDTTEESQRINRELIAMSQYLQQKGIDTSYSLEKGLVAETILETAEKKNADLIIIGAHSHGFLYMAFIGSVSTEVLKHSNCPVLIIPGK
jgi:nucleotide-binding universal stress UspA family protein